MTPSPAQLERARFIRTILARHEHNQTDLGRLLGISQPAASRKLKGLRKFDADELVLIAEAYGIDHGHLLRPPDLADLLGPVRSSAPDLLTWPFNSLPQVSGHGPADAAGWVNIPATVALADEPQAA